MRLLRHNSQAVGFLVLLLPAFLAPSASWAGTPLAVPDHYATTAGVALVVDPPGLLANDVDPEGEALRLVSAGGLANGSFTVLVTNGRFTYVPDPGFVGVETFTYTMEDMSGNTASGTATIEVLPDPNRDPVAIDDAYATPTGVPLVVGPPGLLANDLDLDGESLRLISAGGLANGSFTVLVTDGRFTYVPDPGFVGIETFTYTIEDASGNTAMGMATVEVFEPVGGMPIAVSDAYATPSGAPLVVGPPGLLANDVDPEGEALRLLSAGGLANGSFTVLVTDGRFTYVPDPGFVGVETFTYTMEDASGNQAMGMVTIEVFDPVGDTPLAIDDFYATRTGTALVVNAPGLLANDVDPDGEALRLLSAGGLANGSFTVLVTNGRFTYVPDPGFVGVETFTYTMEDASGNRAMGTATIEVFQPVGGAPIGIPDFYATTEGVPLVVDPPGLLANDVDPEGEALRLVSAGGLANGSFTVLVTNGRFTYVPDPGFVGVETFTYTMEDTTGNRATGMARIEVLADPNRDPVAIDDAYATPAGVPLVVDPPGLLANDLDPDGEPLRLISAGGLANGSFTVLVTDGRFTYVPDPGFVGIETFTYTMEDASGNTATAMVSIEVFDMSFCDVDGNDFVDRRDVDLIFAARGEPSSGPDDPRDADADGLITVNDGRICVLECDLDACATPVPACGLLGLEAPLALFMARAGVRRRRRRGNARARGPGFAAVCAGVCLLLSGSADAISIGLQPSAQTVGLGDTVRMDVVFSDLGGEIVSAYDLDVIYDASVLAATDVSFTGRLGDALAFEVFDDFDVSLPGVVDLAQLSLLGDASLFALQGGDQVTVATLVFQAVGLGTTPLDFSFDAVNDVKGRNAAVLRLQASGATSTVIPESSAALLFGVGTLLCVARLRRAPPPAVIRPGGPGVAHAGRSRR